MEAVGLSDSRDEVCRGCMEAVLDGNRVSEEVLVRLRQLRSVEARALICHDERGMICPFSDAGDRSADGAPGRSYAVCKRVLDLLGGLVGSLLFVVMVPFVALMIRLQSPGPVFFIQKRVGLNGRHFSLVKFRTMHDDVALEPCWPDEEEDDRLFAFGAFMRRYHIDEFPQFVAVLMGEMSLVGPRPEQVPIVERLRKRIPRYDERHRVLPGLTGWAQVSNGYAGCDSSSWLKTASDLYYLRHRSIWMDLAIVACTVRVVCVQRGRTQPDRVQA